MWKRGGRSSALDRAQALLSAKRNRGDAESTQGSAATPRPHAGAMGVSMKTRPAPPNTHTLLSDLSDLSSVSSAPENGANTVRSAALEKSQGREGGSTKDLKPQSSLGGGGSRFLKKAPPPATNSSQQMPEPRYVSSSQQTAAMSRLAQIESRFRSHKQAQEQARQRISPPPEAASQSLEASMPVSAQSSSDQSLKGKRFLKKKPAVAVDSTSTAACGSPQKDVGVKSRSIAAGTAASSAGLEMRSLRAVSSVSLESDEEDMKKLLGDSLDSTDSNLLRPGRPSSMRTAEKMLRKSSQKFHSTPPPAALCPSPPSNTAPPRSPTSPSRRSSPFRFTGQAQARFSPSVLSPSPSPPRVSPFPPRLNSAHRAGSPQRSFSSMSGHSEVLSLEELFPVGPGSEDPHSEMSLVSSEDFKINVMTLDDLVPASFGFTEETREERKAKHSAPVPGSPNRHQQPPRLGEEEKEEEQQQGEEEHMLDYQSDFESESRTDPNNSASLVSEHLWGGDEVEVVSEVREEEPSNSDVSRERTEDDYSSTFSDTISRTSDHSQISQSVSRSRDSRSSVSHSSQTSCHQSRSRASVRKVLKEAAVQTQPDTRACTWSTGMVSFEPPLGMSYMNPTSLAAHTLSAETVEALSTFNPAVFVLNEMLKQQLAMTRRFIESSRHLHSSLVQSLEPPNYIYTTLEDTKEYIRKHRRPRLTVEEALEEVLQ